MASILPPDSSIWPWQTTITLSREQFHYSEAARGRSEISRLRVHIIADQYRRLVTHLSVQRRAAPPQRRLVHHVVVQERRRMQQLRRRRQTDQPLGIIGMQLTD